MATEYRYGSLPEHSSLNMPGLRKFYNITCKRGLAKGDNKFAGWLTTAQLNSVERRDLVVDLLNKERILVMAWQVRKALPVKVEGSELKASSNEVAIESIELLHEGLEMQNDV